MRRFFHRGFGSVLLLVLVSVACAPVTNTANIGRGPDGSSDAGGNQATETKALPEFGNGDLQLRALEELMRIDRTAGFLSSMPAKPDSHVGCMAIKHPGAGNGLQLQLDCAWSQTLGGESLLWNLKSLETYNYGSGAGASLPSARADSVFTASRPGAATGANPVVTFKTGAHRYVSLAPGLGTRALSGSSVIGNAADLKADYWEATVKGDLLVDLMPMQLSLTQFEFSYRPARAADKPGYLKLLRLVPTTVTTFDGNHACHRPVGIFNWSLIVAGNIEQSGTIRIDAAGLTELSVRPDKTIPWPDSCVEFVSP